MTDHPAARGEDPDPAADPEIEAGLADLAASFGAVPETFRVLLAHAPDAFAGYTRMRRSVLPRDGRATALDRKTKELIFALLDVQAGNPAGAKSHAAQATRLGLTAAELAEGLVQVLMVAGITSWNLAGRQVLEHVLALEAAAGEDTPPP